MRVVSEQQLERTLAAPAGLVSRASSQAGTSRRRDVCSTSLERALERYRLFMLAAQAPLPQRDGVILETPFVGPGMRGAGERLDYLPMRLSLVPRLFATIRPPDVVLLHTSTLAAGRSRLGSR